MILDDIRGVTRLERAFGAAGAAMLGLLVAWRIAPQISTDIDARASLRAMSAVITYRNEVLLGQFASYVIALACAFVATALYAVVARVLRRWPFVARLTNYAVAFAPVVIATRLSAAFGQSLLVCMIGGAFLIAPWAASGLAAPVPSTRRTLSSFVIATEATCLAWALFLVASARDVGFIALLPIFVLYLYVGTRITKGTSATLDAIAGAPLFALCLLGLARGPSPWLVAVVVASVVALRMALDKRARTPGLPMVLPAIVAPWALVCIIMVPLGLRDLPTMNHGDHEAFNLAWINSVLHGRFLWADAGLVHGPLRDYAMILGLAPFGITFEHVRIGFVLVNVIGLALAMPLSWIMGRRVLWAQLLASYLFLLHSPARAILYYRRTVSLGWADLTRSTLPAVALFGALFVLAHTGRISWRRLVGYGVLMGASLIYSQEFAICAALGVVVALVFDRLMRATGGFVSRVREGVLCVVAFGAGSAIPVFGLLAVYAAFGKGRLLIVTAYESMSLAAAGVWGSLKFPIEASTFLEPKKLFEQFYHPDTHGDSISVFLIPVAIYLVTMVIILLAVAQRRWNHRLTLYLALLVFGVTCYRVTSATPDIWHLHSATTPSILLAVGLIVDASRFRFVVRARTAARRAVVGNVPVFVRVGVLAAVATASVGFVFGEFSTGINRRLADLASGEEKAPAPAPAYQHPDVPRAGDVLMPKSTQEIVVYIRSHSKPNDPIFIMAGMFTGAELYFLADRRNPTRFDTMSELITFTRRDETMAALHRDPPVLVIGDDAVYVGAEISEYLRTNWPHSENIGGYWVRSREETPK